MTADPTIHADSTDGAAVAGAKTDAPPPPGIWRDDNVLVIRRGAIFPPRCVKCNALAADGTVRVSLWSRPWQIFKPKGPCSRSMKIDPSDLFADWALLSTIFRACRGQTPKIEVGLCPWHRKLQKAKWLAVFAVAVLIIVRQILALIRHGRGAVDWPLLLALGVAVCVLFFSSILWSEDASEDPLRLHGAGRAFLDELPAQEN